MFSKKVSFIILPQGYAMHFRKRQYNFTKSVENLQKKMYHIIRTYVLRGGGLYWNRDLGVHGH